MNGVYGGDVVGVSSVDYQGRYGETALMIAILQNRLSLVELLLQDGGANTNVRDRRGTTALMLAAMNNRMRMIPLILGAAGTRASERRCRSTRGFEDSSNMDDERACVCDPFLEDDQGECACIHALKHGHMEAYKLIARLLYFPLHDSCKKDPSECLAQKMFQPCLKYNQVDIFEELFKAGYCLGNLVKEGVAFHSLEICEVLACSCVARWDALSLSPKERSAWADEVFMSVLDGGSDDLDADTVHTHLKALIDHGLATYLGNPNEHLLMTQQWGTDVLKQVMRYSTDVNFQSEKHGGATALHATISDQYSSSKGTPIGMLRILLDAGADVTRVDSHGLTVFHRAIYCREPEALKFIIESCGERIRRGFFRSYSQRQELCCIEDANRRIASSSMYRLTLDIQLDTCLDQGMREPCCVHNFLQYVEELENILHSRDASYVLPYFTLIKDDEHSVFSQLSFWHDSETDASPEYSDDSDYYSSSSSDEYVHSSSAFEEEDEDYGPYRAAGIVLVVRGSPPDQADHTRPWWATYPQS